MLHGMASRCQPETRESIVTHVSHAWRFRKRVLRVDKDTGIFNATSTKAQKPKTIDHLCKMSFIATDTRVYIKCVQPEFNERRKECF